MLVVRYRGHPVGIFKPDLLVNDAIILEFKCSEAINDLHRAQLLNYLRASNVELGFLFNFGHKPTFERFVFDNTRKRPR